MQTGAAMEFFSNRGASEHDRLVARQILKEIVNRLGFLYNVGLTLCSAGGGTLSGGEAQRSGWPQIRLSLVGAQILDGPHRAASAG